MPQLEKQRHDLEQQYHDAGYDDVAYSTWTPGETIVGGHGIEKVGRAVGLSGKPAGVTPTGDEFEVAGAASVFRLGRIVFSKIAARRAAASLPRTLREVNLKGLFQKFGKNLADEGRFFGWTRSTITKASGEFTKQGLLARGWTKSRLEAIAKAYEQIARITPDNPSAAVRAVQLRRIIAKCFP